MVFKIYFLIYLYVLVGGGEEKFGDGKCLVIDLSISFNFSCCIGFDIFIEIDE